MSILQPVKLTERFYQYVRYYSIKDVYDATVEMLTNAHDAYHKLNNSDSSIASHYHIIYDKTNGTLSVIDNALGLTGEDMKNYFGQVGTYTSTYTSRGFFSRGAKDISAIGNVYFEAFKDGKYSRFHLTPEATWALEVDTVTLTPEEEAERRTSLKIPGNGLSVRIHLLDQHKINSIAEYIANVPNIACLRDIFSDVNNFIYVHVINEGSYVFYNRMTYTYPTFETKKQVEFEVPDYPGVNARFVMYKAKYPIPEPPRENMLEFGFLIKSYDTIHYVTCMYPRFRTDYNMPYLFGYIHCDYINDLLYKIDTEGVSDENPTPIIDPSRVGGINTDHPFIQKLYRIPKEHVDAQLKAMDEASSSALVSTSEFNQIIDQLENYGVNLLDETPQPYQWVEDEYGKLAKTIEDSRASHVTVERTITYESDDIVLDNEGSLRDLIDLAKSDDGEKHVYIVNDNNQIIELTPEIDPFEEDLTSIQLENVTKYLEKVGEENQITKHPYIYQIDDDGTIKRLSVFGRGSIGTPLTQNPDNLQTMYKRNKAINIIFSRNVPSKTRYEISFGDGKITVYINLNHPIVKEYLIPISGSEVIEEDKVTILSLGTDEISNNKSYVFLQELFTEIFAYIILQSKLQSNSIILDTGDSVSNLKRAFFQYGEMKRLVEVPLRNVFEKFRLENSTKIIDNMITEISCVVNDPIQLEHLKISFTEKFGSIV